MGPTFPASLGPSLGDALGVVGIKKNYFNFFSARPDLERADHQHAAADLGPVVRDPPE